MKLLLFGPLAEIAGEKEIEMPGIVSTDELRRQLDIRYPDFSKHSFVVAVNKKIERDTTYLSDSDEIALLPPFSGG